MSYRIHIGTANKKKFEEKISSISNIDDEGWDELSTLLSSTRDTELIDSFKISQFTPIKKLKDEEYPPYILDKNDFQKILDYYKVLLYDDNKRKDKSWEGTKLYVEHYFKRLISEKKNIDSSGLFLLDYFYLVRMFENIKDDECFIITHG